MCMERCVGFNVTWGIFRSNESDINGKKRILYWFMRKDILQSRCGESRDNVGCVQCR